jgi:hypothetical protein
MRTSRRGGTKNWNTSFPKVSIPDAGPMAADEFQHACAILKITDSVIASELLGMSWRTCQRYWHDELYVPPPLARLLRLAVDMKMTHAQLRKLSRPIVLKDTRQV